MLFKPKNNKTVRAWAVAILPCAAFIGCAEGTGAPSNTTETSRSEIRGGKLVDSREARATVFIGNCSAVALSPNVLATAEHCIPMTEENDDVHPRAQVELAVRSGLDGKNCATTDAAGECAPVNFRVVQQPATDLVLLVSAKPLALTEFASIALDAPSGRLALQGYGVGSLGEGSRVSAAGTWNLSAHVDLLQADAQNIYALAPQTSGVCGGDSGGPAFVEGASSAIVAGVLSASTPDPKMPACTLAGGMQRWTRIDPAFVRSVADLCVEQRDAGGARALDCHRSTRLLKPAAAIEGLTKKVDVQRTLEVFRALNPIAIHEGSPKVNAALLRTLDDSVEVVGVRADGLDYTLVLDRARSALFEEHSAPHGELGVAAPVSARALSLSNGIDSRDEFFVQEAGGVRGSSASTGKPGCTGTLIGRRMVRTAAHCLNFNGSNYFTIRYDGGVTTWTFDGGATYVTFNPVRASTYYYGGLYFSRNCDDNSIRFANQTNDERCASQDWAILILPEDAWDPQNVIPRYMGFSMPNTGAVKNVGYPSCSDVSSSLITSCTGGFMYGQNCNISVNSDIFYYTSCDTSPGHSGGPTYWTSSAGSNYLMGDHIAGPFNGRACTGSGCPSQDCGTGTWLYDFQSDLRTQYNTVQL